MEIKKDRCNGTDWKVVVSTAFVRIVAIIIIAFVIFLVIFSFYIGFNKGKNDVFVGLCTLFTGILAITGVCFTIFNSQRLKNKELLNELDQKSEWRKELMNIAAKPVMQLEDVYRILASLRFLPKSENEIIGEESEQQKEQKSKLEQQEKQDGRQSNEEGKKGGKIKIIEKVDQIKKNLT